MAEATAAGRRLAARWLVGTTVALSGMAVLLLWLQPRSGTDTTLSAWALILGWLAWLSSLAAVIVSLVSWFRVRNPTWWLAVAVPAFLALTWLLWLEIPKAMLS